MSVEVNSAEDSISKQQTHAEELISSLPLVRYLRSCPSTTESGFDTGYKEFRLHSNKRPDTFSRHLVAGSLFGEQKLPIYPRLFMQKDPKPRIVALFYIGSHLCGHPGYVHGGLPFVLFDDIFALCAGMGFNSGVAMTANMNINFRKPCLPESLCIIRAEVVKQQGRKAWVEGSIRSFDQFSTGDMSALAMAKDAGLSTEELNAALVAEATSVFVEPKFADSMISLLGTH
ncbi:thioesterase family protein [Pochonia chlamydosporia 170]|uniref:Thioesterase family protein n=1 Tax=Pochonia chlamydosporia 170 TaxID=1380566 RepID=A0A179F2R0_METCM|nr:thioesterase family protein [Pochonia chlamydosporia 170]OAQ59725.2 thioesterase family protein [Pochonia chlamydosporia 170]